MKTKRELAEYRREWNLKNKDKKKEAAKRYYEKNKEKIKEYSKQYRQENIDEIRIKDCDRAKLYYNANKPEILETLKEKYKNNPEFFKDKHYRQNYKITLDEYNNLFKLQNGKCVICGTHQSQLTRKLSVDHNHKTQKIRGLLCNNCNHGIGKFMDNIEYLKNAIEYLSTR